MKTMLTDNTLTLVLEGRIDSNNAAQVEQEALDAVAQNPGAELALDAENLDYISSAGLRVLMKLRKQAGKSLPVWNVSPEVYEIFDVTGFTDLLDVHKALRTVSVEGCEIIGQGGFGTVYRLDEDTIVKVHKPHMKVADIQRERDFARTAFINGIPSVIAYDMVKVSTKEGDGLGVVFEMLKSDTLGAAVRNHPEKMDEYVDQWVELAKTLHSTHVPAGTFTRIQDVMHHQADNMNQWLTEEEIALLHSIIDDIPDADTVTHNDLHPGNIMIQDGELVLIDMPEVTMGPPVCDLVCIFRDMLTAPQSSDSSIVQSIGMPKELIMDMGNRFFMKYTGITDPSALQAYYQKLGLLFAFNGSLVAGTGAESAVKLAPILVEKLFRGVVVPNEQAIRYLFKTL